MSLLSFILLTISYLGVSTFGVLLTPSTSLTVCPGEQIIVQCASSASAMFVEWGIRLAQENRGTIRLPLLGVSRNRSESDDDLTGLRFSAELTSLTPAHSTFTTTASMALDNAQVMCLVNEASSTDTLTIHIQGLTEPGHINNH